MSEHLPIDIRVWAWDMSRPLGEFPTLIEPILRMFDHNWRQTEVLATDRKAIQHIGRFASPEEVDNLQAGVAVHTVRLVKSQRPDGVWCARFLSPTDQSTFCQLWFDP